MHPPSGWLSTKLKRAPLRGIPYCSRRLCSTLRTRQPPWSQRRLGNLMGTLRQSLHPAALQLRGLAPRPSYWKREAEAAMGA